MNEGRSVKTLTSKEIKEMQRDYAKTYGFLPPPAFQKVEPSTPTWPEGMPNADKRCIAG